jgi:hypothetical protein
MSLRETDVIETPQHLPPTNWQCRYTDDGFAPDIVPRGNDTPARHSLVVKTPDSAAWTS